ncbi:hypothetical protein GPJ56_006779 [Histomonas meleagridis]|uniref:uncharacterized protein n=1 Tax=Histomonas meleagridis TaxID=135588 RepID=UPI003559494B|nr:hypothetical protein GPJ56_006779 [Histomonas meleagridis]KAH0802174.1 hypothetical protein GO595_005033 [Histomonas meleagridis]
MELDGNIEDRLQELQEHYDREIKQMEEELKALRVNSSEINTPKVYTSAQLAPHWEKIKNYARNGQHEEAIYALVRVVQKLLARKALKRTLIEKANRSYVDSLYERVSSGIKDNLHQCTNDSLNGLEEQILVAKDKIADLRKYVQNELTAIQKKIDSLKEQPIVKSSKSDHSQLDSHSKMHTIKMSSQGF